MVGLVNGDPARPVNESRDERAGPGQRGLSPHAATRRPRPCCLRQVTEEHWALWCIVGTQRPVIVIRLQFHLSHL